MKTRILVAAGATVCLATWAWQRQRARAGDDVALWAPMPVRRPVPEDLGLPVDRTGDRHDRGGSSSVRMDLTRAQAHHLEPVIEFLTFVQDRRGDHSHLLFVRYDDLDAIAEREGEGVENFLSRLDQLGVIISQN